MQRVDHRIARDMDAIGRDILTEQCLARGRRRGAVQRGETAHDAAVHLLWPWLVDIAAAESRLDMADGNPAVISRDCARHHRGRIALHHHPIGPFVVQHLADLYQRTRRQRVERLARRHQVEIVVGSNVRDRQDLIEHLAVLCRNAHPTVEPRIGIERVDQWEQLDRFGTRPEHGENLQGRGHARDLAANG